MRSLILYGSPTKLSNAHKLVTTPNSHPPRGTPAGEYYVRAVVFNGTCEEAFERVKPPMNGETFLNTVPI